MTYPKFLVRARYALLMSLILACSPVGAEEKTANPTPAEVLEGRPHVYQ